MGDVVHAVPVVEDIKRFISDAEIDWLVEDSFADIPRHVAGVSEVIECSVRKWKKRIFEKSTRDQIKALREKLRGKHYDLVIDLQGLIKSAVLASWTNAPVAAHFSPTSPTAPNNGNSTLKSSMRKGLSSPCNNTLAAIGSGGVYSTPGFR